VVLARSFGTLGLGSRGSIIALVAVVRAWPGWRAVLGSVAS